jgi:hypothetical protein
MVKKIALKCCICGEPLYRTDKGGYLEEWQCSSESAKFWNFERGTIEQKQAHEHFHQSLITLEHKEVK